MSYEFQASEFVSLYFAQVSAEVDPSDPFSGISPQSSLTSSSTVSLKAPPKWLRRPCAANFAVSYHLHIEELFSY